jgi:7,8-dihydropterin-6-yl-methyl-4-(beta-D-ribofuranosyl)aminobenzene 5'-phosphate synthase
VAEKEEVEEIAEWLSLEGIEEVYTGHCTGERGIDIMRPILKDRLKRIYTGMKISL